MSLLSSSSAYTFIIFFVSMYTYRHLTFRVVCSIDWEVILWFESCVRFMDSIPSVYFFVYHTLWYVFADYII